ncbi:MAG: aldehyde dehydrogenase family protein [Oscillospiraceae bacterium]|nr:aldehyde dehydrogenase family protein [Oscillospiraceae bacterium]
MGTYQEMKKSVDAYYPLYINGKWVDGEQDRRMDVFCPANGEKLSTIAVASERDVDRAVQAAQAAFPAWGATPLPKRYEIIMSIYSRLKEQVGHLAAVESLETGRPVRVSQSFVSMGVEYFPYFAALLRTNEDGINSETPGVHTMVIREPIGVVGAVYAWNVPLLLNFWKLAPALAAGDCIVLKPSSYAPIGSMEALKLIADLLPPGVLNVVNGKGATTGQYVLDHPGIDKLSFTGSTDVGVSVGLAAAKRIIPATLELGGKSAGIYFADIPEADMPNAIQAIVMNAIVNSGQICAMQSRVLVEEPLYDRMVEQVSAALNGIQVGPPWQEDAMMGSLAYEAQLNKALSYIEIGQKEGARLVTGGKRLTDGERAKGYFMAPTVFADVQNSMRLAQEEIFGPVLSFIRFNGEEEAIRIANDSKYGLSGGVFTGDLKKGLRVAQAVRTGEMSVNGAPSRSMGGGAFGGYKASGIGREGYRSTLDAFCQLKRISF